MAGRVAGQEGPVISVDDFEARPGEVVIATVRISDATNLFAYDLNVSYGTNGLLTLEGDSDAVSFSGTVAEAFRLPGTGLIPEAVDPAEGEGVVQITVIGTQTLTVAGPQTLATIAFRVSPTASARQTQTVSVSVRTDDAGNPNIAGLTGVTTEPGTFTALADPGVQSLNFPFFIEDDQFTTTFTIANDEAVATNALVEILRSSPASPEVTLVSGVVTLPARGHVQLSTPDLVGFRPTQPSASPPGAGTGRLRVTANRLIRGNSVFTRTPNLGQPAVTEITTIQGFRQSLPTLVFPAILQTAQFTTFAIFANPSGDRVNFTVEGYDREGTLVGSPPSFTTLGPDERLVAALVGAERAIYPEGTQIPDEGISIRFTTTEGPGLQGSVLVLGNAPGFSMTIIDPPPAIPTAPGPPFSLYFPAVRIAANAANILVVSNLNPTPATVTAELYQSGTATPIEIAPLTIAANGRRAPGFDALFPRSTARGLDLGWVRLVSNTNLDGVLLMLDIANDFTLVNYAGFDGLLDRFSLVPIREVADAFTTDIFVANPTSNSVDVEVQAFDAVGNFLGTSRNLTRLQPGQVFRGGIAGSDPTTSLFPSSTRIPADGVRVNVATRDGSRSILGNAITTKLSSVAGQLSFTMVDP